jgi:hypothetical protein
MNNRGIELSMNLIIIASIGLLVLVILAVLIIDRVNHPIFTNNVSDNHTWNFTSEAITSSDGIGDVGTNLSDWGVSITNNITMSEPVFGVIVNDTPIFSMDSNASKFILDGDAWVEVSCDNIILHNLNPDVNNTRCFVRRLV